jgi:hypothetical protein
VEVVETITSKRALQLRAADIVTLPSLQSESPPQDTNVDPAAGAAASATSCPDENDALQVDPQLIPEGVLVTVPLPVPVLLSVNSLGPPPPPPVMFSKMLTL